MKNKKEIKHSTTVDPLARLPFYYIYLFYPQLLDSKTTLPFELANLPTKE